jgi:hypothetical protein
VLEIFTGINHLKTLRRAVDSEGACRLGIRCGWRQGHGMGLGVVGMLHTADWGMLNALITVVSEK